jgi:hypothetical protein
MEMGTEGTIQQNPRADGLAENRYARADENLGGREPRPEVRQRHPI